MNRRRIIVLSDITDVGRTEMALRMITNDVLDSIDLHFVEVEKFSIVNTMFLFRLLLDSAQKDDIFLVVMDPRYNEKSRESLYVKTKNDIHCFVPNNGVISWVLKDFDLSNVYLIPKNSDNDIYPTFNGKYKFAPAINQFLKNSKYVESLAAFSRDDIVTHEVRDGAVLHIDNYGNLKIFISDKSIFKRKNLNFVIKGTEHSAIFSYDFNIDEDGKTVFYQGSSLDGLLEIALIRDSFASKYNIEVGDMITIQK